MQEAHFFVGRALGVPKGLGHLQDGEKLRERGLLSLEEAQRALPVQTNTGWDGRKAVEPGSSQGCPLTGQIKSREIPPEHKETLSFCQGGQILQQRAQSLWSLHSWIFSKPDETLP